MMQGYDVTSCSLEAEEDGYRRVMVWFRNDPPQSWHQPWTRQRHWEANLNRNFAECECGAVTLTPHARELPPREPSGVQTGAGLRGLQSCVGGTSFTHAGRGGGRGCTSAAR